MTGLTKKDLKEVFLDSLEPFAKSVQKDFQRIDQRLEGVDQRLEGVDQRLNKIEATMVTKDYLDDKLADLRGDLVVLTRKEDTKLRTLIEVLRTRKLITEQDTKRILSMEPFPQLFPSGQQKD